MSELLAPSHAGRLRTARFTAGLFSLLDALTGRKMDELVAELLVRRPPDATRCVSHDGSRGRRARRDARLRARRVRRRCLAARAPIVLADAYTQALRWSDQVAAAA